jgi:hypothetical protein
MACGGCSRKRAARNGPPTAENIMGGYKYLSDKQIRARLEVYKRNNCKNCDKRYECDYGNFIECKKHK